MHKKQKGFTLIELLVVIAIIGILSSVVLASLNTARAKGANAAIKADLANLRAQGDIWYDNNGQNYSGLCADTTSAGLQNALISAQTVGGAVSLGINAAGSATQVTCNSSADAWAAEAPLKIAEGGNTFWCVDNSGNSKGEPTTELTTATTYACP